MSQLSVRVEELSPVVRRLDIQVPAERVTQFTENVYRRLGRTVKLKGYRQGHVPRNVLERFFADQIRTDVAREIVDGTFREALGTTQLSPVAAPSVEPQEFTPGKEFSYSARVEVRPDVKLAKYKGLEITVAEESVSDADVDAQLEQLRESMATTVTVEGRDTVQSGDIAGIDYEMAFPGTSRPPAKRSDALIRVEAGQFIDGRGEKLVGAKIGETREFSEAFEGEDVSDELKGKSAEVKVTVTAIKKRERPELDDEFAKDVGGADSLDALKAKIREDLEKQASENNKRLRRNAIMEKLIEENPLEVPSALVDNAAERIAEEFVQNLARRGVPLDAKNPIVEQVKREAQPRATADVKGYFLLDAVAKAEGLEVKPEEVDAKMVEIATEEGIAPERVRAAYRSASALAGLIGSMRNERAIAALEASATFTAAPKA